MGPHILERFLDRPEGPRRVLIAEPPAAAALRPAILLLHGHGASGAEMLAPVPTGLQANGWLPLAARENILLLAPDGTQAADGKRAWNDCRADAPTNATADDVGFLAALLDLAIAKYAADPQRIYVVGTSNGGAMAYRLAIELGPRLAALGLQSAPMAAVSRCAAPTHPIPVYLTHGTADPVTPYAGGPVGGILDEGRGTVLGAEDGLAIWRTLAGLGDAPPTIHTFPRQRADDPTTATRFLWGSDPHGLQIALLRIDGGGHTAPTRSQFKLSRAMSQAVGPVNRDVELRDELWSFLQTKRAACR
ncbi:hypothetical protein E4L96_02450 [Massilia arenosa]|uniref:Phospholipase/carboxylesterase/thioesterase domain-containing protein n=1 Tax=Zemynaea arenosa TaxID=2561931 RepID=A0A4Y9SUV4_9BURK|nr:PHB depolymerase family esterase [Massilia arenosa]TFW28433.1 hypothetical protein E4L96_02450 [Massilia arenosa]